MLGILLLPVAAPRRAVHLPTGSPSPTKPVTLRHRGQCSTSSQKTEGYSEETKLYPHRFWRKAASPEELKRKISPRGSSVAA